MHAGFSMALLTGNNLLLPKLQQQLLLLPPSGFSMVFLVARACALWPSTSLWSGEPGDSHNALAISGFLHHVS